MKIFLLILGLNSFVVSAQDISCQSELKKHCSGIKGQKEELGCIQKNFNKFSKDCGNKLIEMNSASKRSNPKCSSELEKYCEQSDANCYQQHRSKVSPECRNELDDILTLNSAKLIENCMTDVEKSCPFPENFESDPQGQAKYNECVLKNIKNFSGNCLETLGVDKGQLEDKTKVIEKEKR